MDSQDTPRIDPKIALMVGGGVLVLIVIIVVLLGLSKKKSSVTTDGTNVNTQQKSGGFFGFGGSSTGSNNSSTGSNSTIKKAIFNSTNDIAATVLTWLNSQRSSNSRYLFGSVCMTASSCQTPEDNPNGLAAIWGRYKYYQQTKDQKDLEIIKKDLKIYSDMDGIGRLQNNSWNCKLMFDLSKDTIFNSEEQKQIKDICFNSVYYVPDEINKLNLKEQDIPITDLPELISNLIKSPVSTATSSSPLPTSLFNNYVTASSDYAAMYQWDKQNINIAISKFYLKKAIQDYNTNRPFLTDSSSKLGIAAVDLFTITKDNQYLSLAYYIFKQNSPTLCRNLEQCYGFGMLSNQLFATVGEEKYKTYKNSTLNYLLENNFDYKGYKGNKFNKNAFYNGLNNYIYPVRDNGLVVGLLTK